MQTNHRSGFTLIEVLVVVLIIGIVLALTIPAVQSSREAARQGVCRSNLRQIGQALAAHHASLGHYPSAILANGTDKRLGKFALPSPLSTPFQLLTYMDAVGLYNSINITSPASFSRRMPQLAESPSNRTSLAVVQNVFLCPSDSSSLTPGNNYRAATGPRPSWMESGPWKGGGGVFPGLEFIKAADISDGSANTVGFSERIRGGASTRFNPSRDMWFSGIAILRSTDDPDEMAKICGGLTRSNPSSAERMGEYWLEATFYHSLYNHVLPPNSDRPDCTAGNMLPAISQGAFTARSSHPGDVHCLFMDGSVRFVKQSIHLATWRALATRAGAERLDMSEL